MESPIEHAFVAAMVMDGWQLRAPFHGHAWLSAGSATDSYAILQPKIQREGRTLRVDVAFVGEAGRVAIELDGHDYHERTKEQAARDRSRDRLLQRHGWKAIRFTGAEVWRDAIACVREAVMTLNTQVSR